MKTIALSAVLFVLTTMPLVAQNGPFRPGGVATLADGTVFVLAVSAMDENTEQYIVTSYLPGGKEVSRTYSIPGKTLLPAAFMLQDTSLTLSATVQTADGGSDMYTARIGLFAFLSADDPLRASAHTLQLDPAYPHPLGGAVTSASIRYSIGVGGDARLALLDYTGRELRVLDRERKSAGTYTFQLDASALQSGTYFIALEVNGARTVQKLLVVR